jgi:hypothetical protein
VIDVIRAPSLLKVTKRVPPELVILVGIGELSEIYPMRVSFPTGSFSMEGYKEEPTA